MMNAAVWGLLILSASHLFAQQMGPGVLPKTPQLPDSPYRVHDGTRPQPKKVENSGAVSISAPSDATILFDGTSNDAWKGGKEGSGWPVKDGVLIAEGSDIRTKQQFSDIQLHLEWRIPADRKVNGQTGGNSGVFLPGGHEIQILESYSNLSYPDGQAGALYGQSPPLVNATTKQGDWQSYDIVFTSAKANQDGTLATPARVSVSHNGVILHHNKAFLGPTKFRSVAAYETNKITSKGPIQLQFHGDPIEFRNIWVRELGTYDSGKPFTK